MDTILDMCFLNFQFKVSLRTRLTIHFPIKISRGRLKDFNNCPFLLSLSWISVALELATQKQRHVLQSFSAQMSLVNSIFNHWAYCALSRPYRKAYIYVLRRVGRVCGTEQSRPADIIGFGNVSRGFRTSSK